MNWFYESSIFITLPIFVGGFVIVSCAIVLALRPVVRRLVEDPQQWDRVLVPVLGTFSVFFGILLALVAVSVYENFAETRVATLDEAAEVAVLYRATTGLPEEVAGPMRTTLEEYVRTVIAEDFPTQRRGVLPESSGVYVDEFQHLLHDFEPQTPKEQAELVTQLSSFDEFIEARRARIDATTLELPVLFWIIIWVGAAINAILIGLIHVRNVRLHLLLAGLLALYVALVMFVTADMDHPYAGTVAVGPGAFERVLVQTIE